MIIRRVARRVAVVCGWLVAAPLLCVVLVGLVLGVTRLGVFDVVWRTLDAALPDDATDDGFKGVVLTSMVVAALGSLMTGAWMLRRSWVNTRDLFRFVRGRVGFRARGLGGAR